MTVVFFLADKDMLCHITATPFIRFGVLADKDKLRLVPSDSCTLHVV